MIERQKAGSIHPEVRERTLVDRNTLREYRYIAGQLTEHGIGPYLVMDDPQGVQTDPEKVSIIVISPHRRSDAFWETIHGLAKELKGVAADKIAEVRQTFVAGKIARIKVEASESLDNSYLAKIRNPLR